METEEHLKKAFEDWAFDSNDNLKRKIANTEPTPPLLAFIDNKEKLNNED